MFNKIFMESVKNNDIFAIKSDLEDFIATFKGDKAKCDEAIEYAIKNSSFNWEDCDKIDFEQKFENKIDELCFEKGRLVQNFTKERYLKILGLYAPKTSKKKFVSTTDVSNDLIQKAVFKGLARRGSGNTLQVLKAGEFSNVSIDMLESLIKWLEVKTRVLSPKEMAEKFNPEVIETPTQETREVAVYPADWNSIFVDLPNVGGKTAKHLSLRVWLNLMLSEGVSAPQAMWILKNVFSAKSLTTAEKTKAIRALNSEKSTFSSTWKLRITRLINSL